MSIDAQQLAFERLDQLNKGCNFSNWLEAFWLDDEDYPQTDQYFFEDVQGLKAAGMNGIRLNVNFERFLGENEPYLLDLNHAAMQYVDSVIAWADSVNMMVVLVNQHGWDELNSLTYNTTKPRIAALWQQLAEKYQNTDPNLLLFEIMNEPPLLLSREKTRKLMENMTAEIRNYTTEHTVVVSGGYYSAGAELSNTIPIADTNVIYTFHFYEPYWFTHQGASWTDVQYPIGSTFPLSMVNAEGNMRSIFNKVANWRNTYNLPVYMGEFGTINYSDSEGQCNWITLMGELIDQFDIPWAYWDCKYSDGDRFGFFEDNVIDVQNVRVCYAEALRLYDFSPITSIDKNEIQPIEIYPNPTNYVISFPSELSFSKLKIYDQVGYQIEISNPTSNRIDVSSFSSGMYQVVFFREDHLIARGSFIKF